LYLLDEIPNLSFFVRKQSEMESELKIEQEKPFLAERIQRRISTAKISYNFSKKLEDEGDFRYRTGGEIKASEEVKAAFRLHREYSGLERFVYRNVDYKPKKGHLKRLIIGNYTTRLGMGTILGYRGKLVDYSDDANGESLLYPDYGGYNGLNLKLGNRENEGELAVSQIRDTNHVITTAGAGFGKSYKHFEPMVMAALTELRNRVTENSISDFKYGINLQSNYSNGYNRFEISAQAGERNSFGAFVTEGKHLFEEAEINYAAWIYDDNYLDLTAGSKAAGISRTSLIEEVDFSYSDKRSGQEGALFKSSLELTDKTRLVNSLIYAQRDKESYNFEILPALERKINQNILLRADHLSRIKHRFTSGQDTEDILRRTRLELRYISPSVYIRSYLAYQTETDEDDYTALFANARVKTVELGEFSVWVNLGEFNHNAGRIDYWYGYIENKNELAESVRLVAKIAHSYRRGETDSHISTVTLGAEVSL
jgi:hypothetical protein